MAIKIKLTEANIRNDRVDPVINFNFSIKNEEQDPILINYLFYDVAYNTPGRRLYSIGTGIYFSTYPGARDNLFQPQIKPGEEEGIVSSFELGYNGLSLIEREREDDVHFEITVYGSIVMKKVEKTQPEETEKEWMSGTHYYKDTNFLVFGGIRTNITIAESTWLKWLNQWGKNITTITLSGESARKLNWIKRELKVSSDENLIERIEESLIELEKLRKGVKVNQSLLWTLPQEKEIRVKMDELLNRVAGQKGEVLITGWIEGALEPALHGILKNGGKVRILARKSSEKGVNDTLNRLKKSGANIKTNNMLHARIVVGEGECMISSADLKTDSLDQNREAGVYTTDPTIVKRAKDFFEKVWNEDQSKNY